MYTYNNYLRVINDLKFSGLFISAVENCISNNFQKLKHF